MAALTIAPRRGPARKAIPTKLVGYRVLVGNNLDIGHLRTFVAIAEHGGFGRAAVALHVAQSTVSEHVRGLERCVAAPLVARHGRGARLTRAGEDMLVQARRLLAVHDDAVRT